MVTPRTKLVNTKLYMVLGLQQNLDGCFYFYFSSWS